MKILYIGNERRDAQTVARALLGIAKDGPLAWAHGLDQCARHLAQNRDLAAIVIDAQIHAGKWPASLRDLRSLPGRPAIVVVVPEGTPPTFDSAARPSDECVVNGPTFQTDLPNAVTRAVARVRGSQPPSTTPNAGQPQQPERPPREGADDAFLRLEPTAQVELEQKLASLTAAFQQAERRHAAAMTAAQTAHELAATEQLTEQERQFHVQIALEREKRRTVEEMLSAATSAREEAERRIASALADADAHARDLQQRHDAALTKASGELAEHRTHLDRELSRAALEGDQLRERLIEAELALEQTRHDHESAADDVARLAQHEADLSALLATVQGELRTAEGRLSETVREIEEARASAARERTAAEHRLELTLARESEAREILKASFEAQLASERLDYENRLAEIQSECGRLAQAGAAATEDVQRLNADLSDARREFQETLGRQSTEHSVALAALGVTLAERDERLKEETARHDAALQASERIRTELQECLQAALAAGRHDIDQIQQTLLAALEGVRAATRRQDTLQAQADRIAASHEAPDGSRAPNTREPRQPEIAVWQELSKDAALV